MGRFVKGAYIDGIVEVISISGDVAVVKHVKTGIEFEIPAREQKTVTSRGIGYGTL